MTDAERLAMLKVMVNSRFSTEDAMLNAYLQVAKDKILAIAYPYGTRPDDVPEKYHTLQVEVATYMVNKRGADYQTQHSENGITRVYEAADVPDSMLKRIVPFCGGIYTTEETDGDSSD